MKSSTIRVLELGCERNTDADYLKIAVALCFNSSLRGVYVGAGQFEGLHRVNVAFITALRLNPARSKKSPWWISTYTNVYTEFRRIAEQSTPPSMLEFLLYLRL